MLLAVKQRIVSKPLHALDESVLDETMTLDSKKKRKRFADTFVHIEDKLNRHYNNVPGAQLPGHVENRLLRMRHNMIQNYSSPPGEFGRFRALKLKQDKEEQAKRDYHAFSSAYEIPRGGSPVRTGQPSPQSWGDAEAARRREASEKVESGARARRAQEQEERQKRMRARRIVRRLAKNEPGYGEKMRMRRLARKMMRRRQRRGPQVVGQEQSTTSTPTKPLTPQQQTARREARKKLSEERLRRLHAGLVRARGTGSKPPHMGEYWAASHNYHTAAIQHALKRIRSGEIHHLPVHDLETGKTSMQKVQPSHLRDMLHHGYSAIERGHTPPKGPEVPPKFSSPTPETVHQPVEPEHPGKPGKRPKPPTNPQATGSASPGGKGNQPDITSFF